MVVECQPPSSCPGENTCSEGYEGYGCEECASGYYRNNGLCSKCTVDELPDWAVYVIIGLLTPLLLLAACLGVIAFVVAGLVSKKVNKIMKIQRFVFKIAGKFSAMGSSYIKMIQFVGIGFSVPLDVDVPAVNGLFDFTQMINLNLETTLQLQCRMGTDRTGVDSTYAAKAVILLLTIYIVYISIVVLLTLFACVALGRATKLPCPAKRLYALIPKVSSRLLGLLAMFYPTICTLGFMPHICYEQSSGRHKLMTSPSILCSEDDSKWGGMSKYSYALIYSAIILIPVIFAIIILGRVIVSRTRARATYEALFGAVWAPYKPNMFFWELWMCFQKAALAGCYIYTWVGRLDQAYLMILIALCLMVVHVLVQPYKDPPGEGNIDNRVESVILAVLVSILVCLLALHSAESEGATNGTLAIVQVVLLLAFVLAFSFPSAAVFYTLRHSLCPCCYKRKGRVTSGSEHVILQEIPEKASNPFSVVDATVEIGGGLSDADVDSVVAAKLEAQQTVAVAVAAPVSRETDHPAPPPAKSNPAPPAPPPVKSTPAPPAPTTAKLLVTAATPSPGVPPPRTIAPPPAMKRPPPPVVKK